MIKKQEHIFSDEEIKNISELGDVLQKIRHRLLSEGIIKIKNGKTIFPKQKNGTTSRVQR